MKKIILLGILLMSCSASQTPVIRYRHTRPHVVTITPTCPVVVTPPAPDYCSVCQTSCYSRYNNTIAVCGGRHDSCVMRCLEQPRQRWENCTQSCSMQCDSCVSNRQMSLDECLYTCHCQ